MDPADDKRMVITPVPELALGDYIVKSTTVSADDNDIDRQQWIFTVVPVDGPDVEPERGPDRDAGADAERQRQRAPTSSASPSADGRTEPRPDPRAVAQRLGRARRAPAATSCCRSSSVLVLLAVLGGYLFTRRGSSTTPAP